MELAKLEQGIKYSFCNRALLQQALTHRSAVAEMASAQEWNERLEFLGDAVLDLVLSSKLVVDYPQWNEGKLSQVRAAIVCEESLSRIGSSLNLGSHLILGRGEELSGGRSKASLTANAVEAVIGAVFLDGGYVRAQQVVLHLFKDAFTLNLDQMLHHDHKSRLQEWVQDKYKYLPQYKVVAEVGPDHDKEFLVEVALAGKTLAMGRASTKKKASQKAAEQALESLNILNMEESK